MRKLTRSVLFGWLGRLEHRLYLRIRRRLFEEHYIWGEASRVHVAPTAMLNDGLLNTSSGQIFIGEHVMFGHGVQVITGTHDITRYGAERAWFPTEGRDIHIEDGVWIASGAVVVGPCRIGRHAVVAAGSVVRGDVAPYAVVGGVPARELKRLPPAPGDEPQS